MDKKKPDFDIEGFAPGSIVWIRCQASTDIEEMTKTIEELELDQFIFIVTGPEAQIDTLSKELLQKALNLATQMRTNLYGATH